MTELVHTHDAFSIDRSGHTTTANSDWVILFGAGALIAVITVAFAFLPVHSAGLPVEATLGVFAP